jgi:hypothetical protein
LLIFPVANSIYIRQDVAKDASLILQLAQPSQSENSDDIVALGPHKVQLVIHNMSCKNPRFWIRLVGDALVRVDLAEDSKKRLWSGSFSLPAEGSYSIDARWYGCKGDESTWTSLPEPVVVRAVGSVAPTDHQGESFFTVDSSWVSTKSIQYDEELPEYIWKHPKKPLQPQNLLKTSDSFVLKEGTVADGFYAFDELGNYEILW